MKRLLKRAARWALPFLVGYAVGSPWLGSLLGRVMRWAGYGVTQVGVALAGGLSPAEAYRLVRGQLPPQIGLQQFRYDAETGQALIDVVAGKATWAAKALDAPTGDEATDRLDRLLDWLAGLFA